MRLNQVVSMTDKQLRDVEPKTSVLALIGVGSLLDLRGAATYRKMTEQTPARTKTTVLGSFNRAMGTQPDN